MWAKGIVSTLVSVIRQDGAQEEREVDILLTGAKKTNKAFHKEQMAREDTAYDRNCFSDNTVLKITSLLSYVRLSSP